MFLSLARTWQDLKVAPAQCVERTLGSRASRLSESHGLRTISGVESRWIWRAECNAPPRIPCDAYP
jgi:hypothetical protein